MVGGLAGRMRTDSPHIAGPYGQKTSQSDAHATTQQCSIHFGSSFSLHASPIMAAAAAAAAALATGVINSSQDARYRPMSRQMPFKYFFPFLEHHLVSYLGVSVAEWLAWWIRAQKGLGSNRSRDAVG